MQVAKYKNYELSFDEESLIITNKINNTLEFYYFGENLDGINFIAPKTNLKFDVNSFTVKSENEIKLDSNLPKNIPSILLNCDKTFTENEKEIESKIFDEFFN